MTKAKTEKVELLTFPDNDENYAKAFTVPRKWLEEELVKMFKEGAEDYPVEKFLEEYTWDMTWFIFANATAEGVAADIEEVA